LQKAYTREDPSPVISVDEFVSWRWNGAGHGVRMKRFLAAGAAFGCGFMIAAKITQGRSGWLIPWPVASSALHPTTAVVLLVSPGCGACNDPSLPLAWAEIVRNVAAQQQEPYRIGVVSSPLPGEGLTFLRQFGEFHEVLAGGGWAGVGVASLPVP